MQCRAVKMWPEKVELRLDGIRCTVSLTKRNYGECQEASSAAHDAAVQRDTAGDPFRSSLVSCVSCACFIMLGRR